MRFFTLGPLALLFASTTLSACASPSDDGGVSGNDAITSNDAKILDFKFEAELLAAPDVENREAVVSQLMYTQGILTTARNGNGYVGNTKIEVLSDVAEGGKKRIKYRASMPVAWPKGVPTPTSYELPLPLDATAFDAFNAKYDGSCGRNEYGRDTFWHDWNPKAAGCTIDDGDVTRAVATDIVAHPKETKNKYPEYDEIWKDDRLDVVAIFGIISSNTPGDWGYREAASFLSDARALLTDAVVTDNPPSASIHQDQTLTGKIMVDGVMRDVKVDVMITRDLKTIPRGSDFDARFDPISEQADLILYNGHAGLGKNVNALAEKGRVAPNKYQLVLMNGCQTFAYLGTTLFDRRREANGRASDPDGTKYLDVMGNALPGYANNLASMSSALFAAAAKPMQPKHYNELMTGMPQSHIVVVFGEEDNTFQPPQ